MRLQTTTEFLFPRQQTKKQKISKTLRDNVKHP